MQITVFDFLVSFNSTEELRCPFGNTIILNAIEVVIFKEENTALFQPFPNEPKVIIPITWETPCFIELGSDSGDCDDTA
jgi:hypothetical protein